MPRGRIHHLARAVIAEEVLGVGGQRAVDAVHQGFGVVEGGGLQSGGGGGVGHHEGPGAVHHPAVAVGDAVLEGAFPVAGVLELAIALQLGAPDGLVGAALLADLHTQLGVAGLFHADLQRLVEGEDHVGTALGVDRQ